MVTLKDEDAFAGFSQKTGVRGLDPGHLRWYDHQWQLEEKVSFNITRMFDLLCLLSVSIRWSLVMVRLSCQKCWPRVHNLLNKKVIQMHSLLSSTSRISIFFRFPSPSVQSRPPSAPLASSRGPVEAPGRLPRLHQDKNPNT